MSPSKKEKKYTTENEIPGERRLSRSITHKVFFLFSLVPIAQFEQTFEEVAVELCFKFQNRTLRRPCSMEKEVKTGGSTDAWGTVEF